jgi:hypothetical protein
MPRHYLINLTLSAAPPATPLESTQISYKKILEKRAAHFATASNSKIDTNGGEKAFDTEQKPRSET